MSTVRPLVAGVMGLFIGGTAVALATNPLSEPTRLNLSQAGVITSAPSGVSCNGTGHSLPGSTNATSLARWAPREDWLAELRTPPVYDSPPVITSVAFSPDGTLLAVSGHREVLLHDVAAKRPQLVARLIGQSRQISSAVFSPDGRRLAVSGGSAGQFGEVQVWDLATDKQECSLCVTNDTLYGASWSPNGQSLAYGGADDMLRVADAATGRELLALPAHRDWVLGTDWAASGGQVVSVSRDGSLSLTDLAGQKVQAVTRMETSCPKCRGLSGGLMAVSRRPHRDQVLVAGANGAARLYQLGQNLRLSQTYPSLPGRVFSLQFNSDGRRFVAGSSYQGRGEARVLETESGQLISQTKGTCGGIFAVSLRPDGEQFAAAGRDGRVRIYQTQTGQLLQEFVPVPLGS